MRATARRGLPLFAVAALAACASNSSSSDKDDTSGDKGRDEGTDTTAAAPARCDLAKLGLGGAARLSAYRPPSGCARAAAGAARVRTEDEFRAAFRCPPETVSGIDFGRDQLAIEVHSLSPATIGGEAVDDGTKVHYLSHFREPCPGEGPPMPIEQEVMFLLPSGIEREVVFAGGCTVARCEK